MAPGKTFLHKMEASELSKLATDSSTVVIYWLANKHDSHDNIIRSKYPSKVLAAFTDVFGENPKSADFIAWSKNGIVKVVLDWMLNCCDGTGLKAVKDIEIDMDNAVASKVEGEFGRYFKTAYLFDFAQEYKIKYLEDKLKREMEFQAKGQYAIRSEEIYDMANYFWQPGRDKTAISLMVDSIAKGMVKETIKGKRKQIYNTELALWTAERNGGDDDLAEKVAARIEYFQDPKNEAELNEVSGKPKMNEDAPVADADGNQGAGFETWNADAAVGGDTNGWDDGAGKDGEMDKENMAPEDNIDWAADANEAAEQNQWSGSAPVGAPSGGW